VTPALRGGVRDEAEHSMVTAETSTLTVDDRYDAASIRWFR
jgi:hypothetical protein